MRTAATKLLAVALALAGCGGAAATSAGPASAPEPPVSTAPAPSTTAALPASTAATTVPEGRWTLRRVTFTWSGGFAGRKAQTVEIADAASLATIARALPAALPEHIAKTASCADCFDYVLVLDLGPDGSRRYATDDANLPESLRPAFEAIRALAVMR